MQAGVRNFFSSVLAGNQNGFGEGVKAMEVRPHHRRPPSHTLPRGTPSVAPAPTVYVCGQPPGWPATQGTVPRKELFICGSVNTVRAVLLTRYT